MFGWSHQMWIQTKNLSTKTMSISIYKDIRIYHHHKFYITMVFVPSVICPGHRDCNFIDKWETGPLPLLWRLLEGWINPANDFLPPYIAPPWQTKEDLSIYNGMVANNTESVSGSDSWKRDFLRKWSDTLSMIIGNWREFSVCFARGKWECHLADELEAWQRAACQC